MNVLKLFFELQTIAREKVMWVDSVNDRNDNEKKNYIFCNFKSL